MSVLLNTSSPTVAPVSRFRVSRTGKDLLYRWRLASASGILGFALLAHGHRVTSYPIPAHSYREYRIKVHTSAAGPYTLQVRFNTGRVVTLHPS